tara:strand:+ start:4621 stop:5886 length:1266 start_codon:yes stop_codon:yes gene_type:complete
MKSITLKEERASLVENMEAILEGAQSEERDLTDDEQKSWEGFNAEIKAVDKKIEIAERQEQLNASIAANISSAKSTTSPKEFKNYSFLKAINEFSNGNLTGLEKEMDQEARNNNSGIVGLGIPTGVFGSEKRTTPQTVANADEMIATEVGDFVGTLQNMTVLGDLATWMYGLSGNMKLPVLSGTTATWEGENDAAAEAGTDIGGVTLSPERLASYMDISKMLLVQTNNSVERAIRDDMLRAIAAKVESAALGTSDGTANEPTGVFGLSGTGSVASGAATLAKMIELETDVAANNADFGRLAYITSAKGRAALKQILGNPVAGDATAGLAAGMPIWNDNMINGYPAFATNNIPDTFNTNTEAGVCFGRWDDLVIAQFGNALDVLVDPYTQAATGSLRIIINSYWDTAFRRAGSFSTCEGITF